MRRVMHDPPFLCACLTPRSAPVGVARVTAEATGVSTQAQHPVHLRDGPDHTDETSDQQGQLRLLTPYTLIPSHHQT